jgi:hypothetical protein
MRSSSSAGIDRDLDIDAVDLVAMGLVDTLVTRPLS